MGLDNKEVAAVSQHSPARDILPAIVAGFFALVAALTPLAYYAGKEYGELKLKNELVQAKKDIEEKDQTIRDWSDAYKQLKDQFVAQSKIVDNAKVYNFIIEKIEEEKREIDSLLNSKKYTDDEVKIARFNHDISLREQRLHRLLEQLNAFQK